MIDREPRRLHPEVENTQAMLRNTVGRLGSFAPYVMVIGGMTAGILFAFWPYGFSPHLFWFAVRFGIGLIAGGVVALGLWFLGVFAYALISLAGVRHEERSRHSGDEGSTGSTRHGYDA